jgi:hypothetical protein
MTDSELGATRTDIPNKPQMRRSLCEPVTQPVFQHGSYRIPASSARVEAEDSPEETSQREIHILYMRPARTKDPSMSSSLNTIFSALDPKLQFIAWSSVASHTITTIVAIPLKQSISHFSGHNSVANVA